MALDQTKIVSVLRARLPEAVAALDKLVRKAERLGVEGIAYKVVRDWEKKQTRTDWAGRKRDYVTQWTDLEVSSGPLRLGDYSFLAKLEVTPDGVLIDQLPGVELDHKWMAWGGDCEHCRVKRYRKHLFVVRNNETGQQMAVGRACLRAFLGIDSPSQIAGYFAFWSAISEGASEDDLFGGFRSYRFELGIESIMAATAVAVRLFGWCSSAQSSKLYAVATVDYVRLALERTRPKIGPHGDDSQGLLWDQLRAEFRDEDEEIGQQVIAWVRNEVKADDSYFHNLKVIFAQDRIVDPKRLGIVVSAYQAWNRAKGVELRKTQVAPSYESKWIGTPAERVRDLDVIYEGGFVVSENLHGSVLLVSFRTEAGDILKWFTSAGLRGFNQGERLKLTATVKEHKEYKGQRQTILSRCVATKV